MTRNGWKFRFNDGSASAAAATTMDQRVMGNACLCGGYPLLVTGMALKKLSVLLHNESTEPEIREN